MTTVAWSPDSSTLALVHLVSVPSKKTVTGYEEEQRVGVFDLASGTVRDLGHGSRPTWSASGAYLAYWNEDGMIHVLHSGQIVAKIDATEPGLGWNGDALLYWSDDEIRVWDSGVRWTLARVESDMETK